MADESGSPAHAARPRPLSRLGPHRDAATPGSQHVTSVALVPLSDRLRLAAARRCCTRTTTACAPSSAVPSRRSCCCCSCWSGVCPHAARHALDHRRLCPGPRARMGADRQHVASPRCWRSPASTRCCASASFEVNRRGRDIAMATNGSTAQGAPALGGKAYPITDHTFDVVVVGAGGAGLRASVGCAQAGLQDRLHLEGVPDPLAHGRGAGRHFGLARQHGPRRLALAHVRHRQGLGLARRPGRDRISVPQRAGRGLRARPLGRAVLAHRGRQDLSAPVRRHDDRFRQGHRAAHLRRRRPHRPRDPAHALRPGAEGAHASSSSNISPSTSSATPRARCAASSASRWTTARSIASAPRRRSSRPAATAAPISRATSAHTCTGDGNAMALRAGAAAAGHGVRAVPPDRHLRRGLPDHRGRARRGRLSRQFRRRALHGALRALGQGPRLARRRQPLDDASRSARAAASARTRTTSILHLDHLDPKVLHERLPGISESARIFAGVDVTKEPIPVLPTVHYNMGGIPTNYHGEVLTKVGRRSRRDRARPDGARRGGLRLGARRQPARLQFADRPRRVRPRRGPARRRDCSRPATASRNCPRTAPSSRSRASTASATPTAARRPRSCALDMQRIMQDNCAVFRTGEMLAEGKEKIHDAWRAGADVHVTDRSLIWNSDLIETLEYDNLIVQAVVTMEGAAQPAGKPRRACARGLSQPRRRQLDEAHAGVDRPGQADGDDRLPPGAHLHDDQRHRLYRAEGAGVLSPPRMRPRRPDTWIDDTMVQLDPPRKLPHHGRQDLAEARRAPSGSPSSASIAGTRTTTPIRASTPISSIATIAGRWCSTR